MVLVIGVGNRWRSDDAVGPLVADRLAARGIAVVEHDGEGTGLMALWQDAARVIVIDAAQSGAPAGTIRRLDAGAEPVPAGFFRYSSHLFGVAEAVETARVLGGLPPSLVIFAIEGADFSYGDQLSPAVAAVIDVVIRQVMVELAAAGAAG